MNCYLSKGGGGGGGGGSKVMATEGDPTHMMTSYPVGQETGIQFGLA